LKLTRQDLALLVALTLMWGVNWPMMKLSLREITPLWFRAVTMTGGVLMLLAWYRWRGADLRMPRAQWLPVLWLALPNIIGWHCLSILGLQELSSGRAAILGFTMPVWTVLLGVLFTGQQMTPRVWLSVVMGTAAVGLLSAQEFNTMAGRPVGVLWMQLAAVCWAAGTLMMRRTQVPMANDALTVWMMAYGAVFFWLAAAWVEPTPDPKRFSSALWWSLLYGVFINYGFAQVIWFGMARRMPPMASSFSIMAVPFVGTLFGMAIVGETPRWLDWLAAACIVVSIAGALLPPRRTAKTTEASA
jgi:drug/metabolite transporter (DMT)-like permease